MDVPKPPGAESPEIASARSPPPSIIERFAAWLDRLATRLLRGALRFLLIEIPEYVFEALPGWARLLLATLKLACWAVIVFGPAALPMYHDFLCGIIPATALQFYAGYHTICDILFYTWTFLALCGSVWGLLRKPSGQGFFARWRQRHSAR